MHSLVVLVNELDGRFDNDLVEKTLRNSPRAVLRVDIETSIHIAEAWKPGINKISANQANLANQFV